MSGWIAAILWSSLGVLAPERPSESVIVDRVDLIEINHFCDDQGRPILHQLIFYEWSEDDGRYQVRDWLPLRKTYQHPQKNWNTGDYSAIWYDKGRKRIVESATLRESWTAYDPELTERNYRIPENRLGLTPHEPIDPQGSAGR